MAKKLGNFAIVLVVGFCLIVLLLFSGCHSTTREFGGEMTIALQPNQKLELTRPMREDEHAETHVYREDSEWGVLEGKVTIIEKEE